MESDKKDKQLSLANEKNLCPVCPHKLGVKVKYTVSNVLLSSVR